MSKPQLVVLAAGMGSRYGSLKQMDGIGPGNEAIIDYSVYDAVRAGFGRVIFVIRRDFAADFMEVFSPARFGNSIEVEYVYQELDKLPAGFSVPEGRVKPWGTNHAVMMACGVADGPFAVINADDFYGRSAFSKMAECLRELEGQSGRYCMVGYRLRNTLSEFGSVSRGVCGVDEDGCLRSMTERTAIRCEGGRIVYDDSGRQHELDPDTIVSMNFFGFTPDYFAESETEFREFLSGGKDPLTGEFYIPSMVNRLVSDGKCTVKVLTTGSQWFGVTYKEDRPGVEARIRALIDAGEYPERLWK